MDFPTSITIAVGTVTAGGVALKLFRKGNNPKNLVTSQSCEDRREEIQKDLDRGEKKFDRLFKAVEGQGKTLARIDERTLLLLNNKRGKSGS